MRCGLSRSIEEFHRLPEGLRQTTDGARPPFSRCKAPSTLFMQGRTRRVEAELGRRDNPLLAIKDPLLCVDDSRQGSGFHWGDWVRGRRAARIVVVSCLLTLLPVSPAMADESAPEITAFRRTSPSLGIPLQPVAIEFTASDQGGSGLEYALFTYRGPTGGIFRVDSEHLQGSSFGTFQATNVIGAWAATGTYVLERVEIYDRAHNMRTYDRASSPQFDFASADFEVENPNQDITAPVLDWAKIWDETVSQGEPVVGLYQARDDGSGVESVAFTTMRPMGSGVNLHSLPGLGAVGPASWVVPLGSPIATYEVLSITVIDRAGNSLTYDRHDGRKAYPERTVVPDHTGVDTAQMSFDVVSSSNDVYAPRITSLEPRSPAIRVPGDQIAVDFEATDEGVGIDRVYLSWADDAGHELEAWKRCGDRTTGTITVALEEYLTVDRDWRLTHAVVADRLDQQTIYYRDGTSLSHAAGSQQGVHNLDLSRFDFRVQAGERSTHEFPDTSREWCPVVADVSLQTPDTSVVAGAPVPLRGIVGYGAGSVQTPVVAIHEYVRDRPRLVSVVRGGDAGGYQGKLSPTVNTTVRSTFLGSDGPATIDSARSPELEIAVAPRITARLGKATLSVGSRAVLSGSVWPKHPGDSVTLQRKTSSGWRAIATDQLSELSAFRFTWKPRKNGVTSYRVVKARDADHARGLSPVRRLTVSG